MVALLDKHKTAHHEACGQNSRLVVGQRYIICPCWQPLTPPGRVFVPSNAWNKTGLAMTNAYGYQYHWSHQEMNQLQQGWGNKIITAMEVSLTGRSVWAENDVHDRNRRGLCVNTRFLLPTNLMDVQYLIDSPGHPATYSASGEETCPADYRVVWLRVRDYMEAEMRLNTIFDADLNQWGNRESICMCLQGS
jgi:hypothetical protein